MRFLLLSLCLMLLAACSDSVGNDAAYPRRTAYPRVPALSDSVLVGTAGNACFELSADALVSHPSPNWLDAEYKALGATLHLSVNWLSSAGALEAAYGNRRQRISLNVGEAVVEVSSFTNSCGFGCEMVVAPEGVATPVQFIASGPQGCFVSGSFVIDGSVEPADSIRPVVDALRAQALLLLNTLHSCR